MKFMRSIKTKLVILYLVLVFLVMVVSSTFILFTFRSNEESKAENEITTVAVAEKAGGTASIQGDNTTQIQGLNESVQVYILSSDGSHTLQNSNTLSNTSIPVIISAANGIPKFQAWRKDYNQVYYREWFEYAMPADGYIIYVRTDASESTKALINLARTLMSALAIALILTGVVGMFFAKTLTSPIIALTEKAMHFAAGELDYNELMVYSNDEIGQLTKSFNAMSKELKFNIDNISTEKNKLEIILHNMNDGVLAYDANGDLLHANNACSEILNGKFDDMSFEDFTHKFSVEYDKERFDEDKTIPIGDKYISLNIKQYINYYDKSNGIVIVLQDVTKHKKLDNMRKEFVANVSHELRTPLTTIKSYTETLIESEIEDIRIRKNFLSIINGEVDRMALLVQDLLDLSKFDNQKMDLILSKINLVDIIKYTISQNQILIDKKNQNISFHYDNAYNYIINGDKGRINQVFNNIISNSMKYSPEGASINVTLDQEEDNLIIFIRDTGIGIPKEDLKLIFERFYRVDKARSREMGGTGLGLAITKEIVEAHGGKIKAQSAIGQGSTMIVRFPKSAACGEIK